MHNGLRVRSSLFVRGQPIILRCYPSRMLTVIMIESVRADSLLHVQRDTLELILTGAPLRDILHKLVEAVENFAPDSVAAIMLLDGTNCLRNAAAPSLPEHYLAAIDGLPANPALGTCCCAAATGEVVITPDFATAESWRGIAHLPLAIGLVGAWSKPILSRDGAVLGTFGTYFREVREPTPIERDVVEVLARTAAIAIERELAEHARLAQNAELRKARDDAEAASRAKSQFLAVMSHELRTPLAGIIGYADLLESRVAGTLTTQQESHIERIKAGAWHLVSVIDEILTFSRVEAGKERVTRQTTDLTRVARECADLLRPQAEQKGIELRVVLAIEEGTSIETDPAKVRQILLNLIGNAIKFTDRGFVEVSIFAADDSMHVYVRDTGRGIAEPDRERVFEPFVQVDQSTTRINGGTGLGLAVSRSLAQLLGGNVQLRESAPGLGTTFVFQLPGR